MDNFEPNISGKDEYLLYRKALIDIIPRHTELLGVELKHILHCLGKRDSTS